MYEGGTQISGSGIIKGTVKDRLNDYTGECRKIGHEDFLPAAFEFECQGSIGQMFAQHFENCVQKRAEELGSDEVTTQSFGGSQDLTGFSVGKKNSEVRRRVTRLHGG